MTAVYGDQSDRPATVDRVSGEDRFDPTSRKKPVNVIPDAEAPLHRPGGHCWCEPTLERWAIGGLVTYRLMHRAIAADPCGVPAVAYAEEEALVPSDHAAPVGPAHRTIAVTCKKPRGHRRRHQDRDSDGRLLAEWSP